MRLGAFFLKFCRLPVFHRLSLSWSSDRGGHFRLPESSCSFGGPLSRKALCRFPHVLLIISALFTLAAMLFEAAIFIKIQPTLFNGAFAIVLFAGLFRGKAMMRVFFGDQFSLTDDTWFRLSFRWACFFLFLAVANEFAWRLLDEAGWVMFKTFLRRLPACFHAGAIALDVTRADQW